MGPLEIKAKMEGWCAYQERCQYEVEQKLASYALNQEQKQAIIAELISNRFIDEERYAEAYVSGKFNIKKWGKIKIRAYLKQKHISEYSIKKAFLQIDGDHYFNVLKQLAENKYISFKTNEPDIQKQVKTQRFLVSRGYEFDLITDALQEIKTKRTL